MSRLKALQTVSYVKVPLVYPKNKQPPPTAQDYELLSVVPEVNNREIVDSFKAAVKYMSEQGSIKPSVMHEFEMIRVAYDKIMLHRMAEQGVPMPFTDFYYPPDTKTSLLRTFLYDNSFWTPHVSEHYVKFLAIFWFVYGCFYTLNDVFDPFGITKS